MTATRESQVMESDLFRYVAEKWLHGWVLVATPIQQGGMYDGFVRVDKTENVATVFSKYDAYLVAELHAKAHGAMAPRMVG